MPLAWQILAREELLARMEQLMGPSSGAEALKRTSALLFPRPQGLGTFLGCFHTKWGPLQLWVFFKLIYVCACPVCGACMSVYGYVGGESRPLPLLLLAWCLETGAVCLSVREQQLRIFSRMAGQQFLGPSRLCPQCCGHSVHSCSPLFLRCWGSELGSFCWPWQVVGSWS